MSYNLFDLYSSGQLSGWSPDYDAFARWQDALGPYADGAFELKGSGKGKVVLLYEMYRQVVDKDCLPHNQGNYGTCVSQAWGLGIDVLQAVEIVAGEPEKFVAKVSTEYIYGNSRVEIGGGRLRGDGSNGAWAAEAVMKLGTVHRLKYGKYDLTEYSGELSRQWGQRGVPDELKVIGKQHPVRKTALIRTYEQARDAIANGYPVAVCSNYGFRNVRDKDGFARPYGTWNHAMLFAGVDDDYNRPGLLCWNSWGPDWITGPVRHNQPAGSFWVDAEVADAMLRQGDSYAMSGYEGFKRQELDYRLF